MRILAPGINKCPNCDTVGEHLVIVEKIDTTYRAGANHYPWTHHIGRYLCTDCGTEWSEDFS